MIESKLLATEHGLQNMVTFGWVIVVVIVVMVTMAVILDRIEGRK